MTKELNWPEREFKCKDCGATFKSRAAPERCPDCRKTHDFEREKGPNKRNHNKKK